jgi:hypothetical protein
VRSKIGWLAGSRDSHHVSRFAAFFILARAEISVDGSCFGVSRFALFFIFNLSFFLLPSVKKEVQKKDREQTLNAFFSFKRERQKCVLSGVNKGWTPPSLSQRDKRETPTFHIRVTRGCNQSSRKKIDNNPSEKFYIIKASMILPQVHLRKPCYDFSFL